MPTGSAMAESAISMTRLNIGVGLIAGKGLTGLRVKHKDASGPQDKDEVNTGAALFCCSEKI